ncbi:MAG: CsbD family protein [Sporichthyaceae bacterium]|nr:CsbD family protein [Sporichthyaceae bacterium]
MSTVVDKIKTQGIGLRGKAVTLRGKAKELAGKATGNKRLRAAGMKDQGTGRLKRVLARIKPGVDRVTGLLRRGK